MEGFTVSNSDEYVESLRALSAELWPIHRTPDDGDADSERDDIEEPFIDDRRAEDLSLEEIFRQFDIGGEAESHGLDAGAIERLNALIPDRQSLATTFAEFFEGLGIKNFEARELLVMGGGNASGPCKGKNRVPAKHLWPNIVMTIRALDKIRDNLGYAIRTTSVYRHPDYNECLRKYNSGVAKNSQHMYFRAIDFKGAAGSPKEWHAAVTAFKNANPKYGIWSSLYKTFVHIDTRYFKQ